MADWLSFIIFAGFFYMMMRYGCGTHMIHGHHGERTVRNHNNESIDPVCGMEVNIKQGYGKMHEDTLYRFCSRNCLDQFETNPEKYIKQPGNNGGEV